MDVMKKLCILGDAAKYDASCSSSGSKRKNIPGGIGNAMSAGCCHTFTADGRCLSLLKVLFTNSCIYDCKYCINRVSNDTLRTAFTPRELADLTIEFYKRNYIEGLFLSSGVIKSPNYTMEQLYITLKILRYEYKFGGYIHVKAIPGADPLLIHMTGLLADRMSVNIELPTEQSLKLLAPQKEKEKILGPMDFIKNQAICNKEEKALFAHAPQFVPAGQSTQMIIGATPDTDLQIIRLAQGLYNKYGLKRVYYSAYVPRNDDTNLPAITTKPPLLREHRLYQADWLMRYYDFTAEELLTDKNPDFNPLIDPKANWALLNYDLFPVDINTADYKMLLRVPGIGVTGAKRIVKARKVTTLDFNDLKKMGIVLKRAQFFIICKGKYLNDFKKSVSFIAQNMQVGALPSVGGYEQMSMFGVTSKLPDVMNI